MTFIVPLKAGAIKSACGSVASMKKGEATWKT